jgi:hypothetical protein
VRFASGSHMHELEGWGPLMALVHQTLTNLELFALYQTRFEHPHFDQLIARHLILINLH